MTAFKYKTCAAPSQVVPTMGGTKEDWGFANVFYLQYLIRGRWRQYRRIRSKRSGVSVFHVLCKVTAEPSRDPPEPSRARKEAVLPSLPQKESPALT